MGDNSVHFNTKHPRNAPVHISSCRRLRENKFCFDNAKDDVRLEYRETGTLSFLATACRPGFLLSPELVEVGVNASQKKRRSRKLRSLKAKDHTICIGDEITTE